MSSGRLDRIGSYGKRLSSRVDGLVDILLHRFLIPTAAIETMDALACVFEIITSLAPDAMPGGRGLQYYFLGGIYQARYGRTGSLEDLNRSITALATAAHVTPHGQPHQLKMLNDLCNSLQLRFERAGSSEDLNLAIACMDWIVNSTDNDNLDRPMFLSGLGSV